MQIYRAPVGEFRFLLDAFGYDRVQSLDAYSDYDIDTVMAMLKHTGTFATEVMLPLNRIGDQKRLEWDPKTGAVTTPPGTQEAYQKVAANGLMATCTSPEYGGSGAPSCVGTFVNEMLSAGNKAFSMVIGLTAGLSEALEGAASEELKRAYLPKLNSGEWTGTMCLTESHCGTDLGLLRAKAQAYSDHYKITGTKIWITFGEHDLTDNIIHLVLARLPGAPPGIKGISCFIVPKKKDDGSSNGVTCGGLEHKMGIHASPTCVINLEDAEGWIVGEEHRGMSAMFVMMNGARLLVGNEGIALSDIAYQTALAFAKDRRQGRSLDSDKRDKSASADCILVHPDVRRMLLNVKASCEGMRALACWTSLLIDLSHKHADEAVRQECDDLVGLLTPVIKSYCTERGFWNVSEALQVCGGAGYTVDLSIEQYLRDARIGCIYEGTNHIQALDLVGRKLPRNGGRAFASLVKVISSFTDEAGKDPAMTEFLKPLGAALKQLIEVTTKLAQKGMSDREEAAAVASSYLNLMALTLIAYCWAVQVKHALSVGGKMLEAKQKTARYFFAMILPEREMLASIIAAGKAPIMAFDDDEL